MCCASREQAQNFQQYIDVGSINKSYKELTLEDHWNSEHMKSVRLRMLSGETLPECDVCNNKLLNTNVYKDYFWQLFKHKYDDVVMQTDITGFLSVLPVSWDYRFSNLCNFKCRMCGDMLSSSWETEQKEHNMVDWNNPKNNWMLPKIKEQITKFQDTQIEQEFAKAVEEHRIEEIYWAGGEPLMYEQHWRYMKQIVSLGDGPKLYARYNTNLSRVKYKGIDLFSDILKNVRDWQICASLDGTGQIGEYIRTGLQFDEWLANFKYGLQFAKHPRQMRIDFTLTLPGMFEVEAIELLGKELSVEILAKVVFSFTPDIVLSPLALPRNLLEEWIDELLPATKGAMKDVLVQLKNRKTFEEEWPETYAASLKRGKTRLLKLEEIRPNAKITMEQILSKRPKILEWWNAI